ncbi:MAG: ABC transporter substrate-binding protein [Chloroflexaceae bacterium]|nr:ABC transporter substrate-binding protein [Chloroflexaceae bacterium]
MRFARFLLVPFIIGALVLAACGTTPAATNTTPAAPAATSAAAAATTDDPARLPWNEIEAAARGGTVNFFMWGGDENINRYITQFVAGQLKEQYDITLTQTPVTDIAETVNKLLGEKTAGKTSGGSVDLVWINGENFRTMRQGGLLYGPWAQQLPNSSLVPWENPGVANDFGYPVEGFEAPWGRAQFVMTYDSAKVPNPPTSFAALLEWARANPGRFTYPAPPDFTGSVFVRHGFYEAAGGFNQLLGPFEEAVFNKKAPAAWNYFNELRPHLWRNGETFPQSLADLDQLFASGEVDFTMNYNPAYASGQVEKGIFPDTTRTFLFDAGTIANTHYVAIPFNSSQKAAAMVVANFLQSPQAQLEKAKPTVWGDLTALDPARLSAEDQAALSAIPRGVATLAPDVLAANALPELQSSWLDRIEKGWQENVLRR